MLNTLFVCGTFNHTTGKKSISGQTIADNINPNPYFKIINGGHITDLLKIFESITNYERVFWFPYISIETRVKTVEWIKQQNPSCILITSKRNIDGKYTVADISEQAISLQSNIVLELGKIGDVFKSRILDPYGNMYLDFTDDFSEIGRKLDFYSLNLSKFNHVHCAHYRDLIKNPSRSTYVRLVKKIGTKTKKLMVDQNDFRYYRGYPSFKDHETDIMYISKREIINKGITLSDFVPVKTGLPVNYYGDMKPSQDAPIHIELYAKYLKATYIYHSHIYVTDASWVDDFLPCGTLEIRDRIEEMFPDSDSINFAVNLKGHGSFIITDNLKYLETCEFYPKPTLEFIGE